MPSSLQKTLRGGFAAMIILTLDVNNKLYYGLRDEIFDSYVWFLRHVEDNAGCDHDVIETLSDGIIFNYFPINSWLKRFSRNPGRVILVLLYLIYFARDNQIAVDKVDQQTIQLLVDLYRSSLGRPQEFAYAALATLHESSLVNSELKNHIIKLLDNVPQYTPVFFADHITDDNYGNPLAKFELPVDGDYMTVSNIKMHKDCVEQLLKNINDYNISITQGEKTEHIIKAMEAAMCHLTKLGFFSFFDAINEWLPTQAIRRGDGMMMAHNLYLRYLESRPPIYLRDPDLI